MMKATNNNNVKCDSDFSTGLKALVMIILCVATFGLLVSVLPLIIPLLWIALMVVAFFGILFGFIQLLGWSINTCKKVRNKGGK